MEMKRTNKPPPTLLPDAIRLSPEGGFSQIRNEILHNNRISYKAKGLLCLLLSNMSGTWISYQEGIRKFGTEGPDSIRSGLKELENAGYLIRIYYVDKTTKRRRGTFWAYTDFPNRFEINEHLNFLSENDLEIQGGKFKLDFPNMGNPNSRMQESHDRHRHLKNKKKRSSI